MISRRPFAIVAGVGAAPAICSMVIAMVIYPCSYSDYGCASVVPINAQDEVFCKSYGMPKNAH
jgi:hypothetical protein